MLGGFLQPAKPILIDNNTLLLIFSKADDFFRASLLERENFDVINNAAKEVFGDLFQVKII